RRWLVENGIEVVIGDPLSALGPDGVGSPENVRNFVQVLVELGLYGERAFVFLHHFRHRPDKETATDEVAQLQGAWGGALATLDTPVTLKPTKRSEELRLHVPKLRHGADPFRPLIVGRIRETAGFELLGEEGDARLLENEIAELLKDGKWRTRDEIAIASKGGI